MAEKNYQIVGVNDVGHVSSTNITGTYGEQLAYRHFDDLKADERTKYAVLMIVDGKGPGDIRSEYHNMKSRTAPASPAAPIGWVYYERSQFYIHVNQLAGGPWYWHRTLYDRLGPYDTEELAVAAVIEYDKKLIANNDVGGRKAFWSVLETGGVDRWGRTLRKSDRSNE